VTSSERAEEVEARSPAGTALVVSLFAAAVVLPLLRQRGNPSWDSLWAEDGFMLYQDVLDSGPIEPLLRGYAGYLVLLPRLLAAPLRWVAPEHVAAWCAVVAAVVTALLAALTYRWTSGWIASTPVRLALCTLVVLMPAAALENTAVLVNTIWALVCVVPWAVLSRRDGRADVVARAGVLFLAATSTPVALLFLPPALAWTWRERHRAGLVAVTAAFLVGALLQLAAMSVTDDELAPSRPERPAIDVARLLLVRLFAVALVGPEQAVRLWLDHGLVIGAVAAAIVVVLLVLLVRRADRRDQLLGVGFAVAGVVLLFALVWSRGTLPWRFGGPFNMRAHMRYTVPAVFLLASGFAVLVGNPPAHGQPGRLRRAAAPLFVAHTVVLVVACFATVGYRGLGPRWGEHLRDAAAQCEAPDEVALVPQDVTPFWGVRIPCDRLPG
jgi:hypothetical protein